MAEQQGPRSQASTSTFGVPLIPVCEREEEDRMFFDEIEQDDQMFDEALLGWLKSQPQKFGALCRHLLRNDSLYGQLRSAAKAGTGVTLHVEGLDGFDTEDCLSGISLNDESTRRLYDAVKVKRNLQPMKTPTRTRFAIMNRYGIFIGRMLFPCLTVLLMLSMYIPSLAGAGSTEYQRLVFWCGFLGPIVVLYFLASFCHEVICKEILFYFFFDEGVVVDLHNVPFHRYLTFRLPWAVLLMTIAQIWYLVLQQAPPQTIAVTIVQNLHYLSIFHQLATSEGQFSPLTKLVEAFPYGTKARNAGVYKYGKINKFSWSHCCEALKPFSMISEDRMREVGVDLYLTSKDGIKFHELFEGCIAKEYVTRNNSWGITKAWHGMNFATNIMYKIKNCTSQEASILICKEQYMNSMSRLVLMLRIATFVGVAVIFTYVFWSFEYGDCGTLKYRFQQCAQVQNETGSYWTNLAKSFPWARKHLFKDQTAS